MTTQQPEGEVRDKEVIERILDQLDVSHEVACDIYDELERQKKILTSEFTLDLQKSQAEKEGLNNLRKREQEMFEEVMSEKKELEKEIERLKNEIDNLNTCTNKPTYKSNRVDK